MRRGSKLLRSGTLPGAEGSEPLSRGRVVVRPVQPRAPDELSSWDQLEGTVRGLLDGVEETTGLRLAFVDPREPHYIRDPELTPVFHVLRDLMPEKRLEQRLLWIGAAALACSMNPFAYGQGAPVPLQPVLLSSPDTRLQFDRDLTFGGMRRWGGIRVGRGFVTDGDFVPLTTVCPKVTGRARSEDPQFGFYELHARALRALQATFRSIRPGGDVPAGPANVPPGEPQVAAEAGTHGVAPAEATSDDLSEAEVADAAALISRFL